MIDLKHLMLYDGKPWDFNRFNEPLVIDLQGLEYKQGGVPVIVKGKLGGHADITIAPIDKRDEIGLAIYADVHVEDGKLPENYTVGLDINIDDKYYMHPGTNLEINQDKWIVSSKGAWIAEPVTINAVYISEETTTTWLIDGWRNTVTQPGQKTEEKEMGHTQTENYDLSQPICEKPQLALEALKQIIQANKDGNNETAIFMTVKRCQTCGAWPTCRLDSDGQHVTIAIECSQDSSHARYIPTMDDTVKDIIRMWNHINSNPFMEDRETRNKKSETEIAYTQQQIDSYSMAVPISQDVNCALAVLKQIIQENMQDSCIATLPIRRCPQCNALPTCRLDDKSTAIIMECVKDGHQHSYYCSMSNDSLTKIIIEWNKAQNIVRNLKSVKDKNVDNYDWDAPIGIDDKLLADVVQHCLEQQETGNGIPKMHICLCKDCCQSPMVFNKEHQGNIFFGCDNPKHASIPINANMSLTEVVESWNELQGKDEKRDSNSKTSVIFPNDTNITIFIYKHGDTIEYYNKKYVINTEHVKLDNVVFAKNPRVFSQPERVPITPYIKEGNIQVDIPEKTLNELDISNIHFSGVILKEHVCEDKHIIDEFALLEVYYGAQSNYLFDRHEEPSKETSLDVMGRNALALPQQAKTIDELEAEADRGLSKPEDVQKLKEANVLNGSQKAIAEVCDEIKELLLEKNRKYGDSALNPCRIFARSDRLEQIRVRIDDKLNRIKNEQGDEDEDVVKDLIGYLVLYTVAQLHDFND